MEFDWLSDKNNNDNEWQEQAQGFQWDQVGGGKLQWPDTDTSSNLPDDSTQLPIDSQTNDSPPWQSNNPALNDALNQGSFDYNTETYFDEANKDVDSYDFKVQSFAQQLPENAPELVANKLEGELKKIEFTRSIITEGSPWSSDLFVAQLDLPDTLKTALYDLRVNRLSQIQKAVIPKLLAKENVVAQSQSGTGKTITFLTGAFKNIDPEVCQPQVLIVLPTFELAHQVCLVADELGKNNPEITLRRALRGERLSNDESITEHIVVGTPGKVLDWMKSKRKIDGSQIKMLIFDEADDLFDVNQNRELMILLKESISPNVQVVMFSATYSDEFCEFISEFTPGTTIMRLAPQEVALDNIKQLYIKVYQEYEKLSILIRILRLADAGNCFIFTQTRSDAGEVFRALQEEGYPVGLISSNLEVSQRKLAFEDFRSGKLRYLVATNVSARGIDIPNVCMVINYSLPYNPIIRGVDCEVYLHRIGRCGRFGKEGLALTFADRENSEQQIGELVSYFSKPIHELIIGDDLEMEEQLNNGF